MVREPEWTDLTPSSREDISDLLAGNDKYKRLTHNRRKETWNKWRKLFKKERINLSGYDLSGKNLSGFDLSGIIFIKTDFSKCNLKETNFTGANLTGADFVEATFQTVSFALVKAQYTNFTQAQFKNVYFSKTNFQYAKFNKASFDESGFLEVNASGADFGEATFTHCSLNQSNFALAYFEETKLDRIEATKSFLQVMMYDAYLTNSTFRECDFAGIMMSVADSEFFEGSSFINSHFQNCTFSAISLIGINFENSHFQNATFKHNTLTRTSFRNADLTDCRFIACKFSKTFFEGANLENASFEESAEFLTKEQLMFAANWNKIKPTEVLKKIFGEKGLLEVLADNGTLAMTRQQEGELALSDEETNVGLTRWERIKKWFK
ncbi:MAG TPA: pentapeptide repeat-containing protein [Candidatus Nanoarchaeia archaeon]|nr:pentapeptide repeat-containing protein [Candidatus Nanoarchaeia archaeon]